MSSPTQKIPRSVTRLPCAAGEPGNDDTVALAFTEVTPEGTRLFYRCSAGHRFILVLAGGVMIVPDVTWRETEVPPCLAH